MEPDALGVGRLVRVRLFDGRVGLAGAVLGVRGGRGVGAAHGEILVSGRDDGLLVSGRVGGLVCHVMNSCVLVLMVKGRETLPPRDVPVSSTVPAPEEQ